MKKIFQALVLASCALFSCHVAAFEFYISSGWLMLPNPDGSFSEVSAAGYHVQHAYGVLTAESFAKYQASPESLFYDYASSRDDGGTNGLAIVFDKDIYSSALEGNSLLLLDDDWEDFYDYFDYECPAYFGGIFMYSNVTTGVSYYIANVTTATAPTEEDDEDTLGGITIQVPDVATSVGRWTLVPSGEPEPSEPPEISCVGFGIIGGMASATYHISDFSRLGAITSSNGGLTNTIAIVAPDVGKSNGTTNVSAVVTGADAGASTFSISFPTENWTSPSLFLFGVEKPE